MRQRSTRHLPRWLRKLLAFFHKAEKRERYLALHPEADSALAREQRTSPWEVF